MRFGIQLFKFLVQFLHALDEVKIFVAVVRHADVTTGVEAVTVFGDLLDGCHFAQAGDIGIGVMRKNFGELFRAAVAVFRGFAAPQTGDVGDKLDLRGDVVAVGTVDLAIDMPRVDEQDLILAGGPALALVQKPKRARKRDRVEHVRADGDDYIHQPVFDHAAADFHLGAARVRSRIRHDKARTPALVK